MQPEQADKPNYDFILKEDAKAKKKMPGLSSLSKPALIMVVSVVLIIILISLGTILGNKNKKVGGLTDVVGQAQEITRVSTGLQFQSASMIDLSTTTKNALASDQSQLKKYASDHKIKLDSKKLLTYQNKQTDARLLSAAQNNNLEAAYITYLRQSLLTYSESLKSAYAGTSDSGVKDILKSSYDGAQLLLSTAPLKS